VTAAADAASAVTDVKDASSAANAVATDATDVTGVNVRASSPGKKASFGLLFTYFNMYQ
jgi:hypothetical protein